MMVVLSQWAGSSVGIADDPDMAFPDTVMSPPCVITDSEQHIYLSSLEARSYLTWTETHYYLQYQEPSSRHFCLKHWLLYNCLVGFDRQQSMSNCA